MTRQGRIFIVIIAFFCTSKNKEINENKMHLFYFESDSCIAIESVRENFIFCSSGYIAEYTFDLILFLLPMPLLFPFFVSALFSPFALLSCFVSLFCFLLQAHKGSTRL